MTDDHANPLDQLRDFIAQNLEYARTHAACASMFVDINDDAGLAYSIRAMAAHTRGIVEATNDLMRKRAQNESSAKQRGAA